jgi:catechol 2,3-dioxygenase-like lactoylglutathione lyase family enzyme
MLRVADLDDSIRFWTEQVGLEATGRGGPFAFLDGGGVQLALNQVDDPPGDASLTEIVLEADDVRASYDELSARGVPFEVDLRVVTSDGSHDLWAAHFRDPDGHLASLTGWV